MNCPYCRKYFSKKSVAVDHVNKFHDNRLLADKMNAEQSLYFSTHGTIHGKCMCGCNQDTEWNFKTGKPSKVSNDPACRKRLSKEAKTNHINTYGVSTLLNDMEHQKNKMQANRPTADVYKFPDGGEVPYLSKLEEKFLMFCDTILDFTSNMVQECPKIFEYYDSKDKRTRQYIPDFYLPDYNLIVEIKDGGDKPNTNPAFIAETKYKVAMKDEAMRKQNDYNYIRISGSNYGPFMETLFHIVRDHDDIGKNKKALIVINENACVDIDERIDLCNTVIGDTVHLAVITIPELKILRAIAITDTRYLDQWLVYDYVEDTIYYQSYKADIFVRNDVKVFKYINNKDTIRDVLKIMYNIMAGESGLKPSVNDIGNILSSNGIYYDDSCGVSNNDERRMDFIKLATINTGGGNI